jgi:hypothetical protein
LAKADDPAATPPEADAFRAKAEELMNKYRVDEMDLSQSDIDAGLSAVVPVMRRIPLCPTASQFRNVYWSIAYYVMEHVGGRGLPKYQRDENGTSTLVLEVYGYESDLRYLEVLYQEARLVFADRMEPRIDPTLTDQENVYRLRSAGMERGRVADMMGWPKGAIKVTRLYKRACEERGEEAVLTGKDMNVKVYREQYTRGFINEFWDRLWRARQATAAGYPVLLDRKVNVDEAYYAAYPHMRPTDTPAVAKSKPDRRRKAWTAADERNAQRAESKAGQAGRLSGKNAAQEVQLGHGTQAITE